MRKRHPILQHGPNPTVGACDSPEDDSPGRARIRTAVVCGVGTVLRLGVGDVALVRHRSRSRGSGSGGGSVESAASARHQISKLEAASAKAGGVIQRFQAYDDRSRAQDGNADESGEGHWVVHVNHEADAQVHNAERPRREH